MRRTRASTGRSRKEYQARITLLDKAAGGVAASGERVDAQFAKLLAFVKAIVEEVHREGYAIVPGLFNTADVARLNDQLAPLFALSRRMFDTFDPNGPRQSPHIHNVLAKTRAVDDVAIHPVLRTMVGALLGHDFVLNAGAIVMAPEPGSDPQQLHRDDGHYTMVPRPHPPLVVTVAIALDDYSRDNGGTHMVPGSQTWPDSRTPQAGDVIQCEMSAGSVLVWDGAMIHGGGANITKDQHRRTLSFNYARGWLRTQDNQYLSIPRETILSMPAELQRDLGYHISARGLGACDNQDPLTYLQRLTAAGGDGAQAALGPLSHPSRLRGQ